MQPASVTENVNEIPRDTNQVLTERQGDELLQNYCDDTDESQKVIKSSVLKTSRNFVLHQYTKDCF